MFKENFRELLSKSISMYPCIFVVIVNGLCTIVYKNTDEWYIEWQEVKTNGNEWYNE